MVEHAVMRSPTGVVVNFYLPGAFHVADAEGRDVVLIMETEYPVGGRVNLLVQRIEGRRAFPIALRVPVWSEKTSIRVNGATVAGIQPGAYVRIDRDWASGDRIECEFDMRGRVTRFPDERQALVAIERGPIVLARDSLLPGGWGPAVVPVKTGADGRVDLRMCSPPSGFTMALRVPLTDGGTITMCDYASTGEGYKRQIADYYGPPKPDRRRPTVPEANVLPPGQENFEVWMPTPPLR
jgi:hypothetical protein